MMRFANFANFSKARNVANVANVANSTSVAKAAKVRAFVSSLLVLVLSVSLCAPCAVPAFAVDNVQIKEVSKAEDPSAEAPSAEASSTGTPSTGSLPVKNPSNEEPSAEEPNEATEPVPIKGQTGKYIYDERCLLSASEFAELESAAANLADKYNIGVYFLTTDYMNGLLDPTSKQRTSYATTYYKEHKLGLNPAEGMDYGDGIMFVIAADSRDYVTIAYGQGSYSFSNEGIAAMEEAVLENIADHKDDWYGAAKAYYAKIGRQLDFYDRHGEPLVLLDAGDWALRLFIILGIPLIITFIVLGVWRSKMKTAFEKDEANIYLDKESVEVTYSNDEFVKTTLVATPKPKAKSSGGGGGGAWGGGGGGGFSSSGGGKF